MKFYTRYAVLRSNGEYFYHWKYFDLIIQPFNNLPHLRNKYGNQSDNSPDRMRVIIPNKIK